MPQPKMLIFTFDPELEQQLLDIPVVERFKLSRVNNPETWVDELLENPPQVAIIQADQFSERECERLVESQLLSKIDVILVSSGYPNEYIDLAMRCGVSYHLRVPLKIEFIEELLDELYADLSHSRNGMSKIVTSELDQFGLLVGSSAPMRRLYRMVRKAADSQASVLIVGESGAGKELVANTIHLSSTRSEKPFIAVNCGALSPELVESELFGHVKGAFTGAHANRSGVFEQAEGGTLFLDEITEMALDHQVKLLRVLESGEYRPVGSDKTKFAHVRVLAATNREPATAIRENVMREDLYFRLAHIPIRVPPLRKREGDIVGLARHFLAYRNAEEGEVKILTPEAEEKIAHYRWPGNVRELKHALDRAYILADERISPEHLILEQEVSAPAPSEPTLPHGIPLEEVERRVILKTLEKNGGNKSETAVQLGISLKTLYNKLEKYRQTA